MINIITIIIVHAEQHFHSHVDNAQLPLIQQKVSWSTVFWVKQWDDHVICSCEFSCHWSGENIGFVLANIPDILSISRGEMGSASLPALTQAIFKAAKGPKPRCVAFLWCWVNSMKKSHHRLQNGHRCWGWSTLGDARKETLRCEPCGRGHQFFEVRQYRGALRGSIVPFKKSRGSIAMIRHVLYRFTSIYLRKMTWRHQKWEESIAMFDFQVFIQLFLHMRWGTWLKVPEFINQHVVATSLQSSQGMFTIGMSLLGLPNGAVWYSNGIICYPTLVAARWCQHQMATGYTNLLIPFMPPYLSINKSRCHHGIYWFTPFNLCVCDMISSTMWNTRCMFHVCYVFYVCRCCCFFGVLSCLFTVFLCFQLEGWKNPHFCMTIVYQSIYLNIYIYHISLVAW